MIAIPCPDDCDLMEPGHEHHELIADGSIIGFHCSYREYIEAIGTWESRLFEGVDMPKPECPESFSHKYITSDRRVYEWVCRCARGLEVDVAPV